MPEGHTIHRLARDHTKWFASQRVRTSSPQGRFEDGAGLLDKKRLRSIEAHGKHLLYRFERAPALHVHLGLYGRFRRLRAPFGEPRGQVRLRLLGDERGFDLVGPSACELLTEEVEGSIRGRLGFDLLRADTDLGALRERVTKSRAAIGRMLLDQSVFAGVGNIFRAEALFEARVHPERKASTLTDDEYDAMVASLTRMMRVGVKYNRIIAITEEEAGGKLGRVTSGERLRIYKAPACPACGGDVRSWDVGARTVYACEACQPLKG
ncbi:MAG: DNA-formamidopyrimidine glycosylase family protein [Planctomycetota bacterium]